MKFKKTLLYFFFLLFPFSFLFAQEHHDHIAPLKCNPALVQYVKEAKKNHSIVWRLISDSLMAKLPFLDDFSHGGPYPNDSLWMDNAAFINNNYPICPITLGVATLDGLNNEGRPYNPNCPPGASYPADSLTSRPFDFSSYYPHGDSIYLSFYYQAGGRGYAPLTNDTLLLQFRTDQIPWTTIWYHLGYTPVFPDTGFHLVMIMLNDTMHNPLDTTVRFNPYVKDFQFRFKNYACTSGNVDQWNIDQVYMNKNRRLTDTVHFSVSFVYESPSLLANYEYMPWEQFTDNDLATTIRLYERNNNYPGLSNEINTTFYDSIAGRGYNTSRYNGGAHNIPPFFDSGYNDYIGHIFPQIKSQFDPAFSLTGPDTLTLTHVLKVSHDFDKWNDTLKFKQVFSDFYAYDDGTAEAAYFINGATPIYLAYQFTLNKPDTLRGLELYFNYIFVDPANYAMRLAIWDNTGPGGSPGNLVFEDDTIDYPKVGDSLNGFTFYQYHSTSPLVESGTFYVGWVQTYGDSLNIGWDYNTNHSDKVYYNVNTFPGGWMPASYSGSMMMRPVFGKSNAHGPIHHTATNETTDYESLSIYPNPATSTVSLSTSMPANTVLQIFTADGREYLNNNNFMGNSIDISTLPAGFYIVEFTPEGGKTYYQKLLIER